MIKNNSYCIPYLSPGINPLHTTKFWAWFGQQHQELAATPAATYIIVA